MTQSTGPLSWYYSKTRKTSSILYRQGKTIRIKMLDNRLLVQSLGKLFSIPFCLPKTSHFSLYKPVKLPTTRLGRFNSLVIKLF